MVTEERVTMREAAALLGVSTSKMWRLVRDGELSTEANPVDRREKLVRRADLERLRRRHRPRPRSIGSVEDLGVPSDRVDEWLEANWHPC